MAASAAWGQQSKVVDDSVLKSAGKTGAEWLSYGLTPGETRYSPLNQINTTNVSRLGLAWSYDIGQGGGSQEATPLVWNGTIYSITNWSVVYAVDARTGKERWRWDPQVNRASLAPVLCCGAVLRGLAIYEGRIIAPILDGRLDALDAETGKAIWEARVAFPQDIYTITMAPRIAKGKVIIGVAGGGVSHARILCRIRCQHRSVRVEVLHRSRRSVEAFRERSHEKGSRNLDR